MVLSLSVSSNSSASDLSLLVLTFATWAMLTVAVSAQKMTMTKESPIGTNPSNPPIANSRTTNSSVNGRSNSAEAKLPAKSSRPISN